MRRSHRAFTLVEVLLAVSLVAVLLGAVFALYAYAMDLRADIGNAAAELASQRIAMDRMTNELRGAMLYPVLRSDEENPEETFMTIGVMGSAESIEFVTARLPGPAAWVQRKVTEEPVPPEPDVEVVTYRLRYEEGDVAGQQVVMGLQRVSRKVLASRSDDSEADAAVLSDHVKFVRFRYFDGEQWVGSWDRPALPVAVEVILGREPLDEDVEVEQLEGISVEEFVDIYPHEIFRRVVFVPGGRKAISGALGSRPGARGRL
jgi:prepilin-type N-terminal cleavage/methylation domain-containing protein